MMPPTPGLLLPRTLPALAVVFLTAGLLACQPSTPFADTVFHNAVVITMDDGRPRADAMAVTGERIVAVGTLEEMGPYIGDDTDVYDLRGRTVLPGINESHIHVRDLGFQQHYAVNLEAARTVADVQTMLRERLEALRDAGELGGWSYPTTGEEGPWLFGLGWTQDRLQELRMANRHELDAVSREVPISLDRIYRGIAVNTRVFELMGIDFQDPATYPDWFTTDPDDFEAGDIILRDPDTGLPNGVFLGDRAPRLVAAAVPSKSFRQRVESLVQGLHVLASLGITAVVEPGSTLGAVTEVYQAAYEAGELPIRAVVYDGWFRSGDSQGLGDPALIAARLDSLGFTQSGDDMLRIRGAKSSADGGIGSRSAALSEPYLPISEDPLGGENYGAFRDPDFEYRLAQFREIARRGWEIHTHACGDAAIRQTMDVYKILMDDILREGPEADLRWSIIHDYLPDEPGTSVIEDMAQYGIVAAINPANLYFEGESFLRNLGPERMARHTPYRTFLDAGIVMASGSDYPNNSPDPWIGIYQMVTRRSQLSGEVYGPDQRIPLMEALKTFTINGAYLTYDDPARGSLTPGKLADFVILDADILATPEEELLEMGSKVLMTVVGGRPVFTREGFELN
jgi:hypothetical protein